MTYWLQQIVMAIVLLGSIVLLLLWPARHVLQPLWPAPVDEFIMPAEVDRAERVLLLSGTEPNPDRRAAVSRSRPRSVVVAEIPGQPPLMGYLAGYRETPDAPLAARWPEPLDAAWVELPLDPDWVLVLVSADAPALELPVSALGALYRPNQLSLGERLGLLIHRIIRAMR